MSAEAVQKCAGCGAGLTLDHLRGTDCPYCKMVFPHHARAVEHAAVVNQVLAQQMAQAGLVQPPGGFGVAPPGRAYGPDVFPTAAMYGAPPIPYAPGRAANKVGVAIVVVVVFALAGVLVAMAAGFFAYFAVR
jgi:hypothetical protein